jgi:hypothetical protein
VIVGVNALAVDIVASRIMGFAINDVPTVALALEAGLGPAEPEVVGSSIASVRESLGRPFKPPPLGHASDPAFAAVYWSDAACSGCQGVVHAVFELAEQFFPWLPATKQVDMYVGDISAARPPEGKVALAWGLCAVKAAREAGLSEGERCVFMHGCPPGNPQVFDGFGRLRVCLEGLG